MFALVALELIFREQSSAMRCREGRTQPSRAGDLTNAIRGEAESLRDVGRREVVQALPHTGAIVKNGECEMFR